jgi:hypothetical protein
MRVSLCIVAPPFIYHNAECHYAECHYSECGSASTRHESVHLKRCLWLEQTLAANFIKLFWCNLRCYLPIASRFDSGYGTGGVNYAEKSFMKLTPGHNVR